MPRLVVGSHIATSAAAVTVAHGKHASQQQDCDLPSRGTRKRGFHQMLRLDPKLAARCEEDNAVSRRTVCVIGAGAAGLACAKELLERGFEVIVLEARDGMGGVWRFDKTGKYVGVRVGQSATSSKYYLGFSDFPIPDDAQDFVSHEAYLSYLESYAKEFDVTDRIRYNCTVKHVKRIPSNEERWVVEVQTAHGAERLQCDAVAVCSGLHRYPSSPLEPLQGDFSGRIVHSKDLKDPANELKGQRVVVVGGGETGAELAHVAAVAGVKPGMLSLRRGITTIGPYLPLPLSGRMPDARTPPVDLNERRFVSLLPEEFKSFVFTQSGVFELRDDNPAKRSPGRVAMSVFAMFSGIVQGALVALSSIGGAAVELGSSVTTPTFWDTSVVPFHSPDGKELSEKMSTSIANIKKDKFGMQRDTSQLDDYTRRAAEFRLRGFNASHYREIRCLLEEYSGARHTANFLTKSDDFIYDLMDGSLQLKPAITGFGGGSSILFEDGSQEDADVVVCCTGYSPAVPFVDDPGLVLGEGGILDPAGQLYKRVFSPTCGKSLGFIGFARPQIGAMPPIAELQARWFAAVLADEVALPDVASMEAAVVTDAAAYEAKIFSRRLRASVDFAKYTKELATLSGCYPDVGIREFFTSNLLWRAFWLGPVLPQAYRIGDPSEKGLAARRYLETTYQTFFTRE